MGTATLAYSTSSLHPTPVSKVKGALFLSLFVVTWLTSLLSPLLLLFSLYYNLRLPATLIVLVTLLSYLPVDWRSLTCYKVQSWADKYPPQYYHSASLRFINPTKRLQLPSKQDAQTLYAIHPHGIFSLGWSMLFCHSNMTHVRFCFAPLLYASPFFRLFAKVTGNPGSASKAAMIQYLQNGESLALPPGGFEEATLTTGSTSQDRVYIQKRMGFVKLCLQQGVQIRPVYAFGEHATFWNLQGCFRLRLLLNSWGVPAVVPWGNAVVPWLPKWKSQVHVVVGEPLVLPKIDKPSREEVQLWHGRYVQALKGLFEEYKGVVVGGGEDKAVKLQVW